MLKKDRELCTTGAKEHLVSAPTCKELGVVTPYRKKKLDRVKINNFLGTTKRTEVAGQATILEPGNLGTSRESQ